MFLLFSSVFRCQNAKLRNINRKSILQEEFKLCIFIATSSNTGKHHASITLGPLHMVTVQGSEYNIVILAYYHIFLMSWDASDDLRIMCGPQCCHHCRRGHSLRAFREHCHESLVRKHNNVKKEPMINIMKNNISKKGQNR